MAAGMGSRFGGLKQMTPVDEEGNSIIHYSIYDAWKAGFGSIVFIIKKSIEKDFREFMAKAEQKLPITYVCQEVDSLPAGYAVPESREKPWGTGHAVLCAKDVIDGPFAVINADDFYGRQTYEVMADFLSQPRPENEFSMVGFRLRNAMTDNGFVARGVCEIENGYLTGVTERTRIEKRGEDAAFTEDGETFVPLSGSSTVSMNFWGYSPMFLRELEAGFPRFLDENLKKNPVKCEYFLPTVTNSLIEQGKARVRVLHTDETWYGVTYREDLEIVKEALARMHREGLYPDHLF